MPGSWAMVVTDEEEGLRFTPGSGAVLGTQMSPQEALDVRIYRLVCLANWLRSEIAKIAAKEMAGAAKRKYMVEPPGMVRSMALLQVLFARWMPNARDCGVGANYCIFGGF